MTESDKERYFGFLEEKLALWSTVFRGRSDNVLAEPLRQVRQIPAQSLSIGFLKNLETELESFFRDEDPSVLREIEEQLFKKHGLRRIGTDPRVLVDRVAKRNRIGSKAEFGAVADYLGEDRSWEDPRRGQLEKLLGQAKVPKEWRP